MRTWKLYQAQQRSRIKIEIHNPMGATELAVASERKIWYENCFSYDTKRKYLKCRSLLRFDSRLCRTSHCRWSWSICSSFWLFTANTLHGPQTPNNSWNSLKWIFRRSFWILSIHSAASSSYCFLMPKESSVPFLSLNGARSLRLNLNYITALLSHNHKTTLMTLLRSRRASPKRF